MKRLLQNILLIFIVSIGMGLYGVLKEFFEKRNFKA